MRCNFVTKYLKNHYKSMFTALLLVPPGDTFMYTLTTPPLLFHVLSGSCYIVKNVYTQKNHSVPKMVMGAVLRGQDACAHQ